MTTKITRLLATVAASGATALAIAAPAATAAPATRSFDFKTGSSLTPGHAHAWGNATFTKKSVSISGRLNDVCPKDGYGAYLDVWVFFSTGTSTIQHFSDTQGCADPDGVNVQMSVNSGFDITGLRFILSERDGGRQSGLDEWLVMDNPKV